MKAQEHPLAELVSRKLAAEKIGVSTETLKRWERRGLLHPIIFNSRLIRYRRTDIDRLVEQAAK